MTSVNGGPSKYSLNGALLAMDQYSGSGGCLVIHPTISFQVDQTFRVNVIHKPADLICMGLYDNFKGITFIDYANGSSVWINLITINVAFNILQPEFLAPGLKTNRGGIVNVIA